MSYYIDSIGYKVFNHGDNDQAVARYKGYCSRCHMTFWKDETVVKKGRAGFVHNDCILAMADDTPRRFDPKWKSLQGALPDTRLLKKKAQQLVRDSVVHA